MAKAVASQEVANMLNDWYILMKKRDISGSIEMKDEIDKAIEKMEEDHDVLLYYQMLDFRLRLLLEDISQSSTEKLEAISFQDKDPKSTDDKLNYYFYLFKGIYEDYKQNHTEALNFFRIAEKRLNVIQNEIEKAEFHYKIGVLYYNLKATWLSIHHINIASGIFQGYDGYAKRVINCKMLIGLNYIDQFKFAESEVLLKEAIEKTEKIGDQYLLPCTYYNMGFLKSKEDKQEEALKYYNKAFAIKDFETKAKYAYLLCVYENTRSLFKTNSHKQAFKWIEVGLKKSREMNSEIFELKFKILYTLYSDTQNKLEIIKDYVHQLENEKAWVDLEELLMDVANYYRREKLYEEAIYFYIKTDKASKLAGRGGE
ncbi:aspartate phosphatase [Bacillus haynesii]|uniref:response regulator aspartate phosphatase n=1 Tax=Bacillus haynesii TaxID=1925021 RepID=UPI0015949CB3|nr:aspartate phosphatase [Bacillus haynesii]NVB34209.1 aspartate phosphatase [Bacillus licheniformis]MCY7780596.1 aspartate phosphatase [Bacillus haynesii]MCY7813852.1 aspartate phosphatase [Bacillus haynesii]MCY8224951.1 aspartate phosphatase [Bacillus haynesii]MCY8242476.1 aspartate phosphatase [Bacillus haynesii]